MCVMAEHLPATIRYHRRVLTQGTSDRVNVNFTKHCTVYFGAYVEASTDAIITNVYNDITHACISLGPSGNRQGSVNCFDLDMVRVVVRRTVKQIVWPDRLLRKAKVWGKKGKNSILKGQIDFLN